MDFYEFPTDLQGALSWRLTFYKNVCQDTIKTNQTNQRFFLAVSDHIWRLPSFGDRYIVVAIAPKSENSKLANQHLPHGTHLLNKKNPGRYCPRSSRRMFVPFIPNPFNAWKSSTKKTHKGNRGVAQRAGATRCSGKW